MKFKTTMKRLFLCLLVLYSISVIAQETWKMRLTCPEEKINMVIDLYKESIVVPTMEDFGPMNGYMNGNIYGVWTVTSHKIKDNTTATLNLSNDLGSETQECLLVQKTDSTWALKFIGRNVIKRVSGKKLVKIPSELTFKTKND